MSTARFSLLVVAALGLATIGASSSASNSTATTGVTPEFKHLASWRSDPKA